MSDVKNMSFIYLICFTGKQVSWTW